MKRSTLMAVLRKLAVTKATYKLVGIILVACGVAYGQEIAQASLELACEFLSGCLQP